MNVLSKLQNVVVNSQNWQLQNILTQIIVPNICFGKFCILNRQQFPKIEIRPFFDLSFFSLAIFLNSFIHFLKRMKKILINIDIDNSQRIS